MAREQLLSTPTSFRGRLIDVLQGALGGDKRSTTRSSRNVRNKACATGTFERAVTLLDSAIPLQGASHADVVEYRVEIPMRYAQCIALLSDGRKVGLLEPRKFLGWSGQEPNRSLVFRKDDGHLEVEVTAHNDGQAPGNICDISLTETARRRVTQMRKFIAIDGSLMVFSGA